MNEGIGRMGPPCRLCQSKSWVPSSNPGARKNAMAKYGNEWNQIGISNHVDYLSNLRSSRWWFWILIYIYIYVRKYIYICVNMHNIHTYIHTYIYVSIYIYLYIYKYMSCSPYLEKLFHLHKLMFFVFFSVGWRRKKSALHFYQSPAFGKGHLCPKIWQKHCNWHEENISDAVSINGCIYTTVAQS